MIKKYLPFAIVLAFSALVFSLYIQSVGNDDDISNDYYESYKKDYRIYSPPLPEILDFAGEKVPLNIYYVSEMLDREILVNAFWQSNMMLYFKRANRFFPVIEPILLKNGVPDDFKYLAVIESGLLNLTSPAGAKGFWQFMKATGNQYGLEINDEVDERLNLEKSTLAACKYLKDAYKIYGNWTEAAASYNMGMGGLNNQMRKQGENSYYDLSLNNETARYVYRILAVKVIFSNPQKYGYYLRQADLYPELNTSKIVVDSSITNFGDFARSYNMSYRMFKELNPWLTSSSLSNKNKKGYEVLIPEQDMFNFKKLRDRLNQEIGIFGDRK